MANSIYGVKEFLVIRLEQISVLHVASLLQKIKLPK